MSETVEESLDLSERQLAGNVGTSTYIACMVICLTLSRMRLVWK